MKLKQKNLPNTDFENEYWKNGIRYVAGVDEVGRGPLAGPVIASAVILPVAFKNVYKINDSKKLSFTARTNLFDIILKYAVSVGVAIVSENIIDELNIYNATLVAMNNAIELLDPEPSVVLVDGMDLKFSKYRYRKIIKGDTKSVTIAAASIIAKVIRDNIMIKYHTQYPNYGFDHNFGYPTLLHKNAIKKYGVLKIHRKTFKPIKDMV